MNRRMIYVTIILTLLMLIFINSYLKIEYDGSLFENLIRSNKITEEERKWLANHGSIIYGADQNAPPLRYVDEESKQYQGLVVDYIRALSIELETEIKVKPLVWDEALKSLAKGDTDICDMFISEERGKHYLFSDPIYNLRGVILVSRDENNIFHFRDLRNKTIAVPKADYAIEFLNSKVSNIDYVFVSDIHKAISLLIEGKVQAVVGDEPVISYFIEKSNLKDQLKILDTPMYEKDCVLAVPKSQKVLLKIINKGIYNLNKKKTMIKIQQKWFGISAPFIKEKTTEKIRLVILIFFTLIILVFYLFYSWNKVLKKEVERRTEELYISRNDLETTFDGLTHLMIVINEECNIVNVNKSFCKLMQSTKNKIIGKNCREFPGVLCLDCNTCIINKTFDDGEHYQNELKYGDRIFEMSTFPLEDKMENVHRVLVMIKDITRVRMSEQQLLHSNKMAAIGQLAAGVAHEIRNPLGLIRNYCYILKNNKNKDKKKTEKSIRIIEASVDKASRIIDNLLNFSRISGNKCEKVNMRNLIDNIIKLEHKVLERQKIRQEVECDEDVVCYINHESIKHILINLISNAIDAMNHGGLLKIECRKTDNTLLITCTDTGTGISEKHLENIFNPFFTTKPPGRGTGLGLYIIYNEVQKFGGEITVSSSLGHGTTFDISLPLRGEDTNEK